MKPTPEEKCKFCEWCEPEMNCNECKKPSPSPEARVDWEKSREREAIEKGFKLAYQAGAKADYFSVPFEMIKIDNAIQAAFEKGREAR